MKTKTYFGLLITLMFLLAAGFVTTNAQDKDEDKDTIKETMKARYETLTKLKEEQKIGETTKGFVEATTEAFAKDEKIKAIVDGENTDRGKLYAIIAKDTETSPEVVGKNNALRIFKKAGDEELFKGKEDKWVAKKDIKK